MVPCGSRLWSSLAGLAPSKTFDLSIGNCAASKVRLEPQCPNVSKQSGEAASTQKKRAAGSAVVADNLAEISSCGIHNTACFNQKSRARLVLRLVLLSVQTIVGVPAPGTPETVVPVVSENTIMAARKQKWCDVQWCLIVEFSPRDDCLIVHLVHLMANFRHFICFRSLTVVMWKFPKMGVPLNHPFIYNYLYLFI